MYCFSFVPWVPCTPVIWDPNMTHLCFDSQACLVPVFVCRSDFWFRLLLPVPRLWFLPALWYFWLSAFWFGLALAFWQIFLPVDLELHLTDYLVSEPCLNKDNVLCILPGLHLVPYSDVNRSDVEYKQIIKLMPARHRGTEACLPLGNITFSFNYTM